MLADSAGTITDRMAYDAYGVMLGGSPSTINEQPSTNLLYSGEQFDTGLQMAYHRARYYDQSAGLWNRLDPFSGNHSDPQSLHKYAFCHQDPVNGLDPSGEMGIAQMAITTSLITVPMTGLGGYLGHISGKGGIKGTLVGIAGGLAISRLIITGDWSSLTKSLFLSLGLIATFAAYDSVCSEQLHFKSMADYAYDFFETLSWLSVDAALPSSWGDPSDITFMLQFFSGSIIRPFLEEIFLNRSRNTTINSSVSSSLNIALKIFLASFTNRLFGVGYLE
jgi:RHS repeat-associated protein